MAIVYFSIEPDSGHHPRSSTLPVLPGQHHVALYDDVIARPCRLPPPP